MDNENNKPDIIFKKIQAEINISLTQRGHAFRTPSFNHLDSNNKISSKIVVLRSFNKKNMNISFHTDIRSNKIENLKKNLNTSFLFYDAKLKTQLKIFTISKINFKNKITKEAWKKTSFSSRKCYLSKLPPSSIVSNPTDGIPLELKGKNPNKEESENGYKHFAVITNQIKSIEWLYLSSLGHRRLIIKIKRVKNKYQWLIP